MSAWDDLPNAKHIDLVIASVKTHPEEWVAQQAEHSVALSDAKSNAWCVAFLLDRAIARNAARNVVRTVAWDTLLALVAYDDCAYMLGSEPGELEILAKFGNEKAMLLLPACKVFSAIKEKENVNSRK